MQNNGLAKYVQKAIFALFRWSVKGHQTEMWTKNLLPDRKWSKQILLLCTTYSLCYLYTLCNYFHINLSVIGKNIFLENAERIENTRRISVLHARVACFHLIFVSVAGGLLGKGVVQQKFWEVTELNNNKLISILNPGLNAM